MHLPQISLINADLMPDYLRSSAKSAGKKLRPQFSEISLQFPQNACIFAAQIGNTIHDFILSFESQQNLRCWLGAAFSKF
jgi:hypothetical protein